jgi:hypothetical protein
MRPLKPIAALVVTLVLTGCAQPPPVPYVGFSPEELNQLVTDQTLYIPFCCEAPYGTLMYLSKDGGGWLDSRLKAGSPPTTSEMSLVLNWHVQEGSQVCLWASPLIGEIPSFIPPSYHCLDVEHPANATAPLRVRVMGDNAAGKSWLTVYPYNAFPASVVDQYMTQLKVLFGGQIPTWHIAQTANPQPL